MHKTLTGSLLSQIRGSRRVRAAGGLGLAAGLLAASVLSAGRQLWFWDVPADAAAKPLALFGGSVAQWQAAAVTWWVAALVAMAGLVLRNRVPVAAFLITGLAVGVHLADRQLSGTPIDLAALVCLYTVALRVRGRRTSMYLLAVGIAGCWAAAVASQVPLSGGLNYQLIGNLAAIPCLALAASWFAGDAGRSRREHVALLEQRATDLERERDQHALLAAAAERAHLTRELHDVVAHSMSVMVIQAQAAQAVLRRDPVAASPVLDEVITVGRQSLTEMRRLLGVARHGGTGGISGDAEPPRRAPVPGLAALPDLMEQVRRAGLPVGIDIDADLPVLPAALDLSAYRIVQEALTNTLKHAGPGARARVALSRRNDTLVVEVQDQGGEKQVTQAPAIVPERGGNGLPGIAERVAALGGELHTARQPNGFLVRAVLPLGSPA